MGLAKREREEKKRTELIGFLTEFLNGEINKFFKKNMKLTEQLTESNRRTRLKFFFKKTYRTE